MAPGDTCFVKTRKKKAFFMNKTPKRGAWQQLFTARQFLTKTQKLSYFNMSRQAVSQKFSKTYDSPENHAHNIFMLIIQFKIMNLKSRNAMNNSPNLNNLCSNCYSSSCTTIDPALLSFPNLL